MAKKVSEGSSLNKTSLKQWIKCNIKAFFIGGVLSLIISASAMAILSSEQVEYKDGESVETAVNELYEKAEQYEMNKIGCYGCTKLKYLESTGTQYIDTSVIAKSGLELSTTVLFNKLTIDGSIVGARNGGNRIYLLYSYPSSFAIGYGWYYSTEVSIKKNTKYKVYSKLYNGEQLFIVDGQTILSDSISKDIDTNLSIYLFGLNYDGVFAASAPARIYDLTIKYNDILVRDYIPVLDSNDTPCLYDKVSKECYYNQGDSDDFLYE